MSEIYLLLGSNLGNRVKNLTNASAGINKKIGKIIKTSSIYETEPWGLKEQPEFLNIVLIVKSNLNPRKVMDIILQIEEEAGRKRNGKWTERIIDIDILFYDNEIINEDDLKIPHPHLHERKFTLAPLAEISPGFIHPVLNKNITELLNDCSDVLDVKRLIINNKEKQGL